MDDALIFPPIISSLKTLPPSLAKAVWTQKQKDPFRMGDPQCAVLIIFPHTSPLNFGSDRFIWGHYITSLLKTPFPRHTGSRRKLPESRRKAGERKANVWGPQFADPGAVRCYPPIRATARSARCNDVPRNRSDPSDQKSVFVSPLQTSPPLHAFQSEMFTHGLVLSTRTCSIWLES